MPLPLSVIDQGGMSPAVGQVLCFRQGALTAAAFTFRNPDGTAPVVADDTAVRLHIKTKRSAEPSWHLDGVAASGAVTFTPGSRSLFDVAGLAIGIVELRDSNGDQLDAFETFVEIAPNLTVAYSNPPVTIPYIRQLLLDRCAQDNVYTRELEFASADIASAAFQALDWWEETVPEDSELLACSVMNFPGREHMAIGAIGQIYKAAGAAMQRNRSPVSGGGLQSDDLKRAELYLQLGDKYLGEFHNWATAKLVKVNMDDFTGCSYNPLFGPVDY